MANRLYTAFIFILLFAVVLTSSISARLTGGGTSTCHGEKHDVCPIFLKGTEKINCGGQPFTELPDHWLPPGVTSIHMENGNVDKFGDKTFAGGEDVTYVNFEDGKLGSISNNTFCGNTPNLRELYLAGNLLYTPFAEAFTCLDKLQTLSLPCFPSGQQFKEWVKRDNVTVIARNTCAIEPTDAPVYATTDGVPTSRSDVKGVNSVNTTISSNQPQTEDSTALKVGVVVAVFISLIALISAWRKKIKEMYRRRGGHPNQEEDAEQGSTMLPREDNAVVLYTALDEPGKVS